jgi:sarcosine oxidase, subunit alpha
VIIAQDTDGMTHPAEIDMGWAIARKKPFFVGKRSVEILEAQPMRRKLAGFSLPADSSRPLEGHLVLQGEEVSGHVTSCEYSGTLERIIGMAYMSPEQATPGSRVPIRVEGGEIVQAEVVTLPFYDPATQRQEM